MEHEPVDPEIGMAMDQPDGSKGVGPSQPPPTAGSGEGFADVSH